MAVTSSADFVAFLLQNDLLEQEQIDELVGELQARFPAPHQLAAELVRRGWLTDFQVQQLAEEQSLVLGKYLLIDRIGSGGMGEVFKARHRQLARVVALKILRKERMAQPEAMERFQREIRALAKLSHPNVVHAYDADEVGGQFFFTMEFVEGVDLFRLIKQSGPLSVALACNYARQAALGLQHAYELGVVHRDIKPSNLLRSSEGVVKILDMGLASLQELPRGQKRSSLTQLKVIGTPDYIAPEQARDSRRADVRSDLYSLGCTLYYLLTGRVPFPNGKTPVEKLQQHLTEEHVPVETVRSEVPPGVRAILRRLITRDVEARCQTPAELAAALSPFAGADVEPVRSERWNVPVSAKGTVKRSAAPAEPTHDDAWHFSTSEMPRPAQTAPACKEKPRQRLTPRLAFAFAVGVVVAAALLGVLIWVATAGRRSAAAASPGVNSIATPHSPFVQASQ
jgi:eukaryotic-like serine/threonine-protein kinase